MSRFGIAFPLVAAVALLAACDGAGSASTPVGSSVGSCPRAPGPVALVESGRQGSPEPVLDGRARDLVMGHVLSGRGGPQLTLVSVEGEPRVVAAHAFSSDAGNDAALADDRAAFLRGVEEAVAGLRAGTAEADPLGALALGARAARQGTVVLADSGLQTVAPLDFRQTGLLDADPADVVEHLRAQRRLPDLTGVTVVLSGIGDVAAPQLALDSGRQGRLVAIWSAIATAGGAACVDVDRTPRVPAAVTGTPEVGIVEVPPPANPDLKSSTLVLPDDEQVGFRRDTADFRSPDAARAALRPVAEWLTAHPDTAVSLTGTTARVGDLPGQRRLALQRADAVKAVLVDAGIAGERITTAGVGSEFAGYTPDHDATGTLLPAEAARNRTVLLEIR
ncbi:OmpA family protein [Pseudonocardia oroxyli]|uniref:OmpA family protein n=1 Tax=Pseudonocardia oroxyli TaxID=366584 RepID=A0A1G8CRQ0_PSEOR|nr:OmpA family protein [Pseudonocardia oroxyli]SDH48207.1 OmpA family protein [Pseudonocardia oroxyli]